MPGCSRGQFLTTNHGQTRHKPGKLPGRSPWCRYFMCFRTRRTRRYGTSAYGCSSRLHVSYAGMHWVAAAIGFLGVAVLVTTSPFPRFIKLLLPFTFYLAFQYAIVARSYVLARC